MDPQRYPNLLQRSLTRPPRQPVESTGLPVFEDRTAAGLRVVVVERSDDGDDVIAVCDGHGMHRWFSGVLTRDDAERAVCERCLEERHLYARRDLIVGAHGWSAWLRVIGRRG